MSMSKMAQAAEVTTKIKKMTAQKLEDSSSHGTKVVFNVGVNIEEAFKRTDSAGLRFEITLDTEPSIAKISIEGIATISGNPAEMEKMLAQDSSTDVPKLLTSIYEEVYPVLFMIVGTLDLPYPSPALLKKAHIAASRT